MISVFKCPVFQWSVCNISDLLVLLLAIEWHSNLGALCICKICMGHFNVQKWVLGGARVKDIGWLICTSIEGAKLFGPLKYSVFKKEGVNVKGYYTATNGF